MQVLLFGWRMENGWPIYYVNGQRYRGLIFGRVYDRTVCRASAGQIAISEEDLFAED